MWGMRKVWLTILVVIMACGSDVLVAPNGVTRFEPPEIYRTWYRVVEDCTGILGNFAVIKWYHTDVIVSPTDGSLLAGYNQGNTIVVLFANTNDETLVRHEMLHHILRNDPQHESQWWQLCADYDDPAPEV